MQIDEKLISYLEDLSYLALPDAEKIRMTADLQKILNGLAAGFASGQEFGTDGVQLCSHPNVFRADEALPSFDRELILKNAPVKNDEFFIAPKTVTE
ncbi:MAG: aspartyl/glutamyl-tRNA amidotransferase subunit C [Treponema sp.]|nr:aspartyl/glutamyl-tRNA amidotransferase subunit C [Treponema sp.]